MFGLGLLFAAFCVDIDFLDRFHYPILVFLFVCFSTCIAIIRTQRGDDPVVEWSNALLLTYRSLSPLSGFDFFYIISIFF